MADLKNLSVEEFAAVTGSDAPAPGGGSVAALAGGLGAALAEMVAVSYTHLFKRQENSSAR